MYSNGSVFTKRNMYRYLKYKKWLSVFFFCFNTVVCMRSFSAIFDCMQKYKFDICFLRCILKKSSTYKQPFCQNLDVHSMKWSQSYKFIKIEIVVDNCQDKEIKPYVVRCRYYINFTKSWCLISETLKFFKYTANGIF